MSKTGKPDVFLRKKIPKTGKQTGKQDTGLNGNRDMLSGTRGENLRWRAPRRAQRAFSRALKAPRGALKSPESNQETQTETETDRDRQRWTGTDRDRQRNAESGRQTDEQANIQRLR